jgi:hypothetical protein
MTLSLRVPDSGKVVHDGCVIVSIPYIENLSRLFVVVDRGDVLPRSVSVVVTQRFLGIHFILFQLVVSFDYRFRSVHNNKENKAEQINRLPGASSGFRIVWMVDCESSLRRLQSVTVLGRSAKK